ncbi:MAG TPA: hypothetical protein VJR04_15670, partial [Terriglobales bacterium]|nr:hypothetical protein [Terriglobales bacterium]
MPYRTAGGSRWGSRAPAAALFQSACGLAALGAGHAAISDLLRVLKENPMLLLKFLLITAGDALLVAAAVVLGLDVYNYIRAR